jgi:hypothetical protein
MYKALISFTGAVSMQKGEVKAIADEAIAKDLVRCGYVEALEKKEDKPASTKKTSAKSKKKVEVIEDGE